MGSRVKGWLTWKKLFWGCVLIIVLVTGLRLTGVLMLGLGKSETVTKSEKTDRQGKITERTTITTTQDAKTLWDWLSLFGVPLSLLILGYFLEQLQQTRAAQQVEAEKVRAEQQAETDKEIAASNQREEALQSYVDRLSDLLIDKNLIIKATKPEDKELVDAAADVIRVRTLSLLRRLGQDGERKGHVLRLLIDTEVISKLKLKLCDANFSRAILCDVYLSKINLKKVNLRFANLFDSKLNETILSETDLFGADLSFAKLIKAKLDDADLTEAKLNNADLTEANLTGVFLMDAKLIGVILKRANLKRAKLINADLSGANLSGADLTKADLTDAKNWSEAQLAAAILCETKLPEGCTLNPNRDAPSTESPHP